jgi:hypothetical protein
MLKMVFENNAVKIPNISNLKINKTDKIFYVCSAGGCGSTMIYNYLSNFGKVYHIHDRYPPEKLCYIGSENTNEPVYSEWFNGTEIPENELNKYKVLFIYRNPIQVIFSRFAQLRGPNVSHLQHIKCNNNGKIYFGDVLHFKKDLYGLEEFFDNYTLQKKRNYEIYCVKYEDFFNNISGFNNILGIPDIKSLYPTKIEKPKPFSYVKELTYIYASLMKKMKMMKFIEIIKPLEDVKINDENDV